MSCASSTRMPPSCSFVSVYGPSVVATLPFFQYKVNAVSRGCRASLQKSARSRANGRRTQSIRRTLRFARPRSCRRVLLARSIPNRCISICLSLCWLPATQPAHWIVHPIVAGQRGNRQPKPVFLSIPRAPATQIRTGGVREGIIREFLARQKVIDETKPRLRTFVHGDGNCAVEFHDR